MENFDDLKRITLKNNTEYRNLLKKLKPHIKYVELINFLDDNDEIILFAKENLELISEIHTNKFKKSKYGGRKKILYTFKFNQKFYDLLKTFNSFFINIDENIVQFDDNFKQLDLAFLDKNKNTIFYIITHEGLAESFFLQGKV